MWNNQPEMKKLPTEKTGLSPDLRILYLIIIVRQETAYALNWRGEILSNFHWPLNVHTISSVGAPSIGDLDGDDYLDVIVCGGDNFLYVWERNAEVYARKVSRQGDFMNEELRLTDRDLRSWKVKNTIDRSDNVHIVFRDVGTNGVDVRYIQLDSNGTVAVPEVIVNDAEGWQSGELRCDIGVDMKRNVHIVWSQYTTEFHYSRLDSTGNLVIEDIPVSGPPAISQHPDLFVSPNGSSHIVFMRNKGTHDVICFSKVDSAGCLVVDSKIVTTDVTNKYSKYPDINVDSSGNSHLLFVYRDQDLINIYDPCYLKLDPQGEALSSIVTIIDYYNGLNGFGIDADIDAKGAIHAVFNPAIAGVTYYSYAKIADGGTLLDYVENISDDDNLGKQSTRFQCRITG